jgi:integrase
MRQATVSSDKRGRRKGSRNHRAFYRAGRGWFTKDKAGTFVPLSNEAGERLRDKSQGDAAKAAYHRYKAGLVPESSAKPKAVLAGTVTVRDVCVFWLEQAPIVDKTRESSIARRTDTLYDLCNGISPKYREKSEAERKAAKRFNPVTDAQRKAAPRIHKGYGDKAAAQLTRADLLEWCNAHPKWTDGGRRTRLQAVKRVMNFAVEYGKLKPEENQIRGMKIPSGKARATYLSADQEIALLGKCCRALRQSLRVLIRTGMRPGCEFAKVTAAHVRDHGDRLEIRFAKGEGKTKNKPRTIRVADTEMVQIVRKAVAEHRHGPIFRNTFDKPWSDKTLSEGFRRAKVRAIANGMTFDDDVCLYSTRHTYAKRLLTGYWGKPVTIDVLAALMGNTVDVCRKHYGDLTKEIAGVDDLLWSAVV